MKSPWNKSRTSDPIDDGWKSGGDMRAEFFRGELSKAAAVAAIDHRDEVIAKLQKWAVRGMWYDMGDGWGFHCRCCDVSFYKAGGGFESKIEDFENHRESCDLAGILGLVVVDDA